MNQQAERRARRQIGGPRRVAEALQADKKPRLLLVRRRTADPEILEIVEEASRLGIPVRYASSNDMRRMSAAHPSEDILALAGPDPGADEGAVLAGEGAVWLLAGTAYPGNIGFAIRTAEVSGADGIFIDTGLVGRGRHRAVRASMHADRFLPVHWRKADRVVVMAHEAGKRVVAIEDTGTDAPWDRDLTGSVLFVIGGEEKGICPEILEACDDILRIPMAGFVPSYNLHAAMAAVAVERLRQLSIG